MSFPPRKKTPDHVLCPFRRGQRTPDEVLWPGCVFRWARAPSDHAHRWPVAGPASGHPVWSGQTERTDRRLLWVLLHMQWLYLMLLLLL